ncbi:hypothetical protein ABBQ32_001831 [Trebouxia sp. C0010 RCD-2024]
MQDNGWLTVGSRGRHKHVATPIHSSLAIDQSLKSHAPEQAKNKKASSCEQHGDSVGTNSSLVSLPGLALALIFVHLDCTSGVRLAQTCHACATEYAAQKAEFKYKWQRELHASISRDVHSLQLKLQRLMKAIS